MSRPPLRPSPSGSRTRTSHSFHAGSPIPTSLFVSRRDSSHYHTFPSPSLSATRESPEGGPREHAPSPLPVRQLVLLAVLSFAEQTALNSISPYIPSMVGSFEEIPQEHVGLYVGILASAFALAQLSTNFFWGYLSDRVGRKPVLIAGAVLLTGCFALFGFCARYWQALLVHMLMGLLNGNAAVLPSALGDVTDRTNQSTVFTWLPIIYSAGGLSGPALGGLLVGMEWGKYPFAMPNIVVAVFLAACTVVVGLWFEETHPHNGDLKKDLDKVRERLGSISESVRQPLLHPGKSRANGTQVQDGAPAHGSPAENDTASVASLAAQTWSDILDRSILFLLATYLIYQLSNISFSSLYPIFAAAPTPTGRDLDPGTIGVTLSVSGAFTIVFQAFLFRPIKARFGNLGLYRVALLGMGVSMAAMPWVGYKDSRPLFGAGSGAVWLYIELGLVLVLKNIASVGGLSCIMLLITNSAESDKTLGTLNGIAQTISAAGRSVGPFLSGGLFTLSMRLGRGGELFAWGLFGGVTIVGYFMSWAIDGRGLESEDDGSEESRDGDGADGEAGDGEIV